MKSRSLPLTGRVDEADFEFANRFIPAGGLPRGFLSAIGCAPHVVNILSIRLEPCGVSVT